MDEYNNTNTIQSVGVYSRMDKLRETLIARKKDIIQATSVL